MVLTSALPCSAATFRSSFGFFAVFIRKTIEATKNSIYCLECLLGGSVSTMRAALLFVVLMSSWLLMSGHYTVLIISLGVVSVGFCVWLSHAVNAIDDEGLPTHIFARLPAYLVWLCGEIVKSNYATAKLILGGHSDPEIFCVTATQKTAAGLATYANSITLTPGTVTMDIDESASKDQFLVHALHADFGDDVRSNDMDRRVKALEMDIDQKPKGKAR